MSKKTYEKSIPKKIFSFVIDVLAAVLLLCAVLETTADMYWMQPDAYKRAVLTDEFDVSVKQQVEKSLNGISAIVEISPETIIEAAGMDKLVRYEHEYTGAVFTAMLTDEELTTEPFESNELYYTVMQKLDEYSHETEISGEDAEGVYTYINDTLNKALAFLPQIAVKAINTVSGFVKKLSVVRAAVIPMWIAAILLITLAFVMNGKNRILDSLFGLLSAAWIAFTTLLIPLVMLVIYNIPSRIVLVKTPVYYFVLGSVKVLVNDSALIFGIIVALLTAALVIVSVLKAVKTNKKRHAVRGFYQVDFDENKDAEEI